MSADGEHDAEDGAALPLAARNALVELLLEDLGAPSRPGRSLVGRARRLLTRAPGAGVGVASDADEARARAALRAARLLLPESSATTDGAFLVCRAARSRSLALQRLGAYDAVLARAPRGRELATRLAQARALFAARLFFEVHEVLEPPWRTAVGRERDVLQGIIQAAVAWHHAARGNCRAALRLASAARVKLADAPDAWLGFPLRALRVAIAASGATLAAGGAGVAPSLAWAEDDDAR